jgi:hypothetical protein
MKLAELRIGETLKKSGHTQHDHDTPRYSVYDTQDNLVDQFYYRGRVDHDNNTAHRNAIFKLKSLKPNKNN